MLNALCVTGFAKTWHGVDQFPFRSQSPTDGGGAMEEG